MSANFQRAEPQEKIVILPTCWSHDALNRLSATIDPEILRRHRAILRAGIEEDIREAIHFCHSVEADLQPSETPAFDAIARKHLDVLLNVLQSLTMIMKAIE